LKSEKELSSREQQIARKYAGGATYHIIADELKIAPSTVRTHLATIYRKLEVSSKLELLSALDGERARPRDQTEMAAIVSELALSLEEAISREKAVSEVLRIIGNAGADIEKVMLEILRYALELCDAEFGILFEYSNNGEFKASHMLGIPNVFQTWLDEQQAFKVLPETGLGRVEQGHEIVNIVDVNAESFAKTDKTLRYATATLGGARSFVAIPMLASNQLVGAFCIYRQQVRPFSESSTRIAQIFADQSVIALENARLLSALREG